jgi:HEPN domain-containing protein
METADPAGARAAEVAAERADLLRRKAVQDEYTLQKLIPDPLVADEIIGFHAQQAIEKLLKAVLAAAGIRYRYTHDLLELVDLLRDHSLPMPREMEQVQRLTPFAAALRYDDLPDEPEEPFDREWAIACVEAVRAWVDAYIESRKRLPASGGAPA